MNQAAIRALNDLFHDLFTPDELRAWLATSVPDGLRIVHSLPSGGVAPANLFFTAVDTLRRYGLLNVADFWKPLEARAPVLLKAKVVELAARFGITINITPPVPRPEAPPSPPASPLVVVLVSASPEGSIRLRVDVEFRRIIERIRGTKFRDNFTFVHTPAARFEDLQTVLLEHKPHILHISSHGEKDGSLTFESGDTGSGTVSKKRVLGLLKALNKNLRLVLLNACHSHTLASEISSTLVPAIGMNTAVEDVSAIAFSTAFYQSLGFGESLETAFDAAVTHIDDTYGDEDIPKLFPPADADPDRKRQLVLVPR